MATVVTKTIREDGTGNYTSVATFLAGEERDLVAVDQIARAQIEGAWANATTAAIQVSAAWVADATRYVEIEAVGAARAQMPYSPTAFRVETLNGGYIHNRSLAHYTKFIGLQFKHTQVNAMYDAGIVFYHHNGLSLRNSIIWLVNNGVLSGGGGQGCTAIASANDHPRTGGRVSNVIIMGDGPANAARGIGIGYNDQAAFYSNVTVVNCAQGYRNDSGGVAPGLRNVVCYGNGVDFGGTSASNWLNCASGDGTHGAGTTLTADPFVDYPNGDANLIAGAQLIDAGADLSANGSDAFAIDFDGVARPQGASWDIGAMEYVAAPAVPTPVIIAPAAGATISSTYLVQVDSGE